jgi:hypothetical protein
MIGKREQEKEPVAISADDYRASMKRLIQKEVGDILDEELRNASREIIEAQRNAIRETLQEHRMVISAVVEEEKRTIRARVDELKRSIIKLGMAE